MKTLKECLSSICYLFVNNQSVRYTMYLFVIAIPGYCVIIYYFNQKLSKSLDSWSLCKDNEFQQ